MAKYFCWFILLFNQKLKKFNNTIRSSSIDRKRELINVMADRTKKTPDEDNHCRRKDSAI